MCKQKHLFLFVFVRKFFEVYLDWKNLEIKGLDYADIFLGVGCYPANSIPNDLPVYAVVCECDEITEFLGRVNNIEFRRYPCRLRTFLNRAFSNGDQIYATTLAKRGFIYIEHAGENLIYCPFCFNFFYYDLVNDENVCTHAPNCPYGARAWNQHGNNNIGVLNITVDIEYREIYRNVHNLFNLPFVNRERTRQDNVNASVRSISIRNLNEFQDIHSRENQIANQFSVTENIDSSSFVHQETETNVIALSDFNRSPDNLITHNSLYNVPRQSSSNSTMSNIVSTASDLLPRATTSSSAVSFNRTTDVTFTPTAITASSKSTASTNCAFDRNFVSPSISPATVRQTSEEAVRQTPDEAVRQTSEESVTQIVSETSQNSTKGNAGGPTYSELGIVTERPKRFEYAVLLKRMNTFLSWPRDHHLRPKELAEAGFYYAGYGDCARCFYCGGGLRNWGDEDDVWVEHARWFPKCAYIRQQKGQVFVDTVQELKECNDHIPFTMVMEKIRNAASAFQLDTRDTPLKRDPAVMTMVDMGFPYADVIAVAEAIKNEGNVLSSDKIYERLISGNIERRPNASILKAFELDEVNSETLTRDAEKLKTLKEQNNQHRQQTLCKICMEKNVEVVFLPCGHLISCTECADTMKYCPVCRNLVRGTVRAFME